MDSSGILDPSLCTLYIYIYTYGMHNMRVTYDVVYTGTSVGIAISEKWARIKWSGYEGHGPKGKKAWAGAVRGGRQRAQWRKGGGGVATAKKKLEKAFLPFFFGSWHPLLLIYVYIYICIFFACPSTPNCPVYLKAKDQTNRPLALDSL